MICKNCGKEIADNAIACPHCGVAAKVAEDKVNIGLAILSFLIPLVGIILWIVKAKETPKAARTYGLVAIASWVLSIIVGIGFGLIYGILMSVMMASM